MKKTYATLLASIMITSCGIQPASSPPVGTKKYGDITKLACADKGGDSDGDSICNADEIADTTNLGPQCVNNPNCVDPKQDDGDHPKTSPWSTIGWIAAGLIAGGVTEAIFHPIQNEAEKLGWGHGKDQTYTTPKGDVITIKGNKVVSYANNVKFVTLNGYPAMRYFREAVYKDPIKVILNGTPTELNNTVYLCLVSKFSVESITSDTKIAHLQFPNRKKVTYSIGEDHFEDHCSKEIQDEGVYLSFENQPNGFLTVRRRSGKDIGFDFVADLGFYKKDNYAKFSNLTTDQTKLNDMKLQFMDSTGNLPIMETMSGKNIILPQLDTSCPSDLNQTDCIINRLLQKTNTTTTDNVEFYVSTIPSS